MLDDLLGRFVLEPGDMVEPTLGLSSTSLYDPHRNIGAGCWDRLYSSGGETGIVVATQSEVTRPTGCDVILLAKGRLHAAFACSLRRVTT